MGATSAESVFAEADAQAAPADCALRSEAYLAQSTILLGEPAEVRLSVSADCPTEVAPLHLVLVLDDAGQQDGALDAGLPEVARLFLQSLSRMDHPGSLAAVVAHFETGTFSCPLTNRQSRLFACLSRLPTQGQGATLLGEGIRLMSVCVGESRETECFQGIASSSADVYTVEEASGRPALFEQVVRQAHWLTIRRLTIAYPLPTTLEYELGSATPAPVDMGPDGRTPTWRTAFVPGQGMAISFSLRPSEPGRHATGREVSASWTDHFARDFAASIPAPRVLVLAPRLLPWD